MEDINKINFVVVFIPSKYSNHINHQKQIYFKIQIRP